MTFEVKLHMMKNVRHFNIYKNWIRSDLNKKIPKKKWNFK